jgi:hypothetical protein
MESTFVIGFVFSRRQTPHSLSSVSLLPSKRHLPRVGYASSPSLIRGSIDIGLFALSDSTIRNRTTTNYPAETPCRCFRQR